MTGARGVLMGLLAAALGAGVVVLPAMAGSETTPSIQAVNGPGIYPHYWSPSHATIVPGRTVALSNPTAVSHGVEWVHGPGTPVCSSGVPVGTTEAASGPQWSGSCTFASAGVYTFYCTVHGLSMSGTITVGSTETATTTTGTTPPGQTGTGTGQAPPPPSSEQPTSGAAGPLSLLAGPAPAAVRVHSVIHAQSVSGSVDLSGAASGATLSVEVLVPRGALAPGGHGLTLVGHLRRSGLSAGVEQFQVRLSTAALRALRRHGHLTVRLVASLSTPAGARLRITRTVHLRG